MKKASAALIASVGSAQLAALIDFALIGAGFLIQVFALPHVLWADGEARAHDVRALLHGTLTGSKYSLVGPAFALPLAWLDALLGSEWFLPRYNVLVLAAGCVALGFVLRQRADPAVLRALVLLLLAGSMLSYHLFHFYGEVFSAMAAAVGLVLVESGRPLAGWSAVTLAAANSPALLVPLALVAALVALRDRRALHLLAPAAALALIFAEAWIRRGSPLQLGYQSDGLGPSGIMPYTGRPGFSYPFLFGVLGILFSFGRGLAFFAPALWLLLLPRKPAALAGRDRGSLGEMLRLWLWFLAGLIVVYAKWWAWHGAVFWGPRFHLFAALPSCLLLSAALRDEGASPIAEVAALLALAFSIWVGIDGAVFNIKGVYPGPVFGIAEGALALYTNEFGPLWRPFLHWTPPRPGELLFAGYALLVFIRLSAPAARRLGLQLAQQARAFRRTS